MDTFLLKSYIFDALSSGSITRADYNICRRCGALMDEDLAQMWRALNGEIWHGRVKIIEDGEIVVEVALSFDAEMNCNGVMSL